MTTFSWVKLQDFYLRLGFLKVLVAVLSPERRSAMNDVVVRRFEKPLFEPAEAFQQLWGRASPQLFRKPKGDAKAEVVPVCEALLVDGGCPSLLYAVTRPTAYKVLDWGHDIDLVGRANQITERGSILRRLLPDDAIERFLAGNPEAWNPFVLTLQERLFFIYHLISVDQVLVELIADLASEDLGTVLESRDAARHTCRALLRVLDGPKDLSPRDIPSFRTAQDLAATIAEELGMGDEVSALPRTRQVLRPVKPGSRHSSFLGRAPKKERTTTKNADHQTIPRFEQLVDLGFLEKPAGSESDPLSGRRRWRYRPTIAGRRWANACELRGSQPRGTFLTTGFAHAAVAFGGVLSDQSTSIEATATYVWRAHQAVARPVGQTPLDSIALHAMISAASDGVVIEMADVHSLLLAIKQRELLPRHAFFASGNELDKMFIQLKHGFLDEVSRLGNRLDWEAS